MRYLLAVIGFFVFWTPTFAIEFLSDDEVGLHESFYKAEKARKSADYRAAIKIYKYMYSQNWHRPTVLKGLTSTYLQANDLFAAEKFLTVDIEKNLFDIQPRWQLIQVYLHGKDYKKAEKQLVLAQKIAPQDVRLHFGRGLVSYRLKNAVEATQHFTTCLENKDCPSSAYFYRALAFNDLTQYEKANLDFKQAYRVQPNDLQLILAYLKNMHQLNQYKDSLPVLQSCVQADATRAECYQLYGDYHLKMNELGPASAKYEKAVKLAPFNHEYRRSFAKILVQTQRLTEADVQFEKALELKPSDKDSLQAWVQTLQQRQQPARVIQLLKRFHQKNPSDLWAAAELAKNYLLIDREQDAYEVMAKAASHHKNPESKIYLAYYAYRAGKSSQALAAIQEAQISNDLKDFYQGLVFSKKAEFEKALMHFIRVPAESAHYWQARYNSALNYVDLKRLAEAVELLKDSRLAAEIKAPLQEYVQYLNSVQERNVSSQKTEEPVRKLNYMTEWSLPRL